MLLRNPCKKYFIYLAALILPCFFFTGNGNCAENQKSNIITKDEIIRTLGGGNERIHLMGAGPSGKLVFGTDENSTGSGSPRGSIPFEYNRFDITEAAKPQLDQLGEALSSGELAKGTFEISGHTDIRGSSDYNLKLSLKRAQAVKNYLEEHFHIPAGNLRAKGYGKTHIIAEGNDEASHARNRRVEIAKINNAEKVQNVVNVPASKSQATPAGFVAQVLYLDDKSGQMRKIGPDGNTVLRTGRNPYQIFYRASRPCYVYVLQKSSDGKWQVLFPPKGAGPGVNPIKPGEAYWLPGYDRGFLLDEAKGTETIYVLASQTEIPDLESTQLPMQLSEARLPASAHQFKNMGIERIGKPKADAGQPASLNFNEIIDNAVHLGSALNSISFVHE
jgi:outer membrane protein OmpA-like peptidoglycan-associated protein